MDFLAQRIQKNITFNYENKSTDSHQIQAFFVDTRPVVFTFWTLSANLEANILCILRTLTSCFQDQSSYTQIYWIAIHLSTFVVRQLCHNEVNGKYHFQCEAPERMLQHWMIQMTACWHHVWRNHGHQQFNLNGNKVRWHNTATNTRGDDIRQHIGGFTPKNTISSYT